MKSIWIRQLAAIIIVFVLFIFVVNKCAAQQDSYNIVGMGCTINNTPMLIPVTTSATFTVDEETDIIGIKVSDKISYMYILIGTVDSDDNLEYKGATFSALDLHNNKYYINMRMYRSGEIQVTIGDKEARAALVFFLQVDEGVDGVTTAL